MRGFHFSLRGLFGAVTFLAVGCGLLVYATPLLSQLTFIVALGVLLAAVVAAACHSGEQRMYWLGFAVFGLAYVWLICGSWQSPDGNGMLRDRLATTMILHWSHEKTPHTLTTTMEAAWPAARTNVKIAAAPDWANFSTTGHSLFALLFAALGGLVATCFYRRENAIRDRYSAIPPLACR